MRHPRARGILTGVCGIMLCSAASRAAAPPTAAIGLGFESVFGAGATACVDPAAALFENPARLARLAHAEAWGNFNVPAKSGLVRASVSAPLLSGPALGLGVTSDRGPARLESVHLGAAHLLPRGVAAGAALTLRTQSGTAASGFGLDLGLHWRPLSRFEAGLALANAVTPEIASDASDLARELRAGAAWVQPVRGTWSVGTRIGWRSRTGSRSAAAAAALLRRGGAEFALGVHDGAWRTGAAVALGDCRVAYAYAADDATHDIAVHWRFGPSRDERRQRAERRAELEMAARVHELADTGEHLRQQAWRAAADSALTHGRFDTAAALYQALVVAQPGNLHAQDGLRRARHGTCVQTADSLLVQHETAAAAVALAFALRFAPDDSSSAHRLQELRAAASTASRMQDLVAQRFAEGMQAYAQQRYLDAVRAFEDVLRLAPHHGDATASLSQAQSAYDLWRKSTLRSARQRYEAGDDAEAAAYVRRLLDVEPRNAEAQKLRARLEQRRARTDAVRPAVPVPPTHAEDAAPVPAAVAARYAEGMQLYRGGDLVGAMHAWEEVARLAPHYEEVDRNLLRVYRVTGLESYTEGRLREAVEIWEKALRLEPGNEQLRRYLNQAHAKLARTPAAEPPGR